MNAGLFQIESETIDIGGLDAMIDFTRYKSYAPDDFLDGLQLSHDLTNRHGTILYARGTRLQPAHLSRLVELRASNPSLDFEFRLNRSKQLIQTFRDEIKEEVFEIFNRQQRSAVYQKFLSGVAGNVEKLVDTILSEENITLLLYQMRFVSRNTAKDLSTRFMEHPVNVAMIGLAIASTKQYEGIVNHSRSKLLDVCRAGLFHNYGALMNLGEILESPEELRQAKYWQANREGYDRITESGVSEDVIKALISVFGYHKGHRELIKETDWTSHIANITVIAEMFLRRENGLFADPMEARTIVDQMNVRVAEKALNERAVLSLTLGLNLRDIFDFYRHLNHMIKACPYGSAVPYPLVGFKSPTLFVCRKEIKKCRFIEGNMKAVNLLHDMGELKKGTYRRCWLLTPKLISFYKKHYHAIKSITNNVTLMKKH